MAARLPICALPISTASVTPPAVLAACLLAVLAAAGPASAQRVTVAGTLRGPNGPIPNVIVFVGPATVRTDAQGRYSATLAPTGGIAVNAESLALSRMGLALPPQVFINPPASRTDADLPSTGRGSLLWVRVVASDGNPPASNFGITAESVRTGLAYGGGGRGAGSNGVSEGRLLPDQYRLKVFSPDKTDGPAGTAEVDLTSGDVVGLVITAQVRGTPSGPRVALARGTVRGPAGPVGGAFVFATDGAVVQADAQGRYTYFVAPNQAITLLVVPPAGSGLASDRIEFPPGPGDASGLDVTLGPGPRVAGTVTVPGGAVPAAGFQVVTTETRTNKRFGLGGAEFEGLTSGRFDGRLPPGVYRVDGLQGNNREFAATQDVDVTLGDAPPISLVLGQTNVVAISGTVRGPNGPIAGAAVNAGPSPQSFTSADASR